MRTRREERGTEKTPDEERLEKHLEEFEMQVNSLTDKSEQSIRDLIDRQAELEDETDILRNLNIPTAPETDDDGEPPAGQSARNIIHKLRRRKEHDYNKMTLHSRYAVNNDYAHFKKVWHDAMAGEEGPPLPDASRWFRDGKPVMRRQDEADDENDDDDIAVAREVLSINCPLTLQAMREPYSNRKCKHTFEKAAILDYLEMRGEKQCPQTGCSQVPSLEPALVRLFADGYYRCLHVSGSMRNSSLTKLWSVAFDVPALPRSSRHWTRKMRKTTTTRSGSGAIKSSLAGFPSMKRWKDDKRSSGQ